MAISFLQRHNNAVAGGSPTLSSVTVTISATAAGSVLMIAGAGGGSGTTTGVTITDSAGDTYTPAVPFTAGTTFSGGFYFAGAFLAPSTGVTTVTVTLTGNNNAVDCFVWEVAGLTNPAIDKHPSAEGLNGVNPDSGSTGTLSAADEAAICYVGVSSSVTGTAGTGWANLTVNANGDAGEDRITAATTAINGTINDTATGDWCALAVTVMSVGGAATQPSSYYSIKSAQQVIINGAQPHLLAYESYPPRGLVPSPIVPYGKTDYFDARLFSQTLRGARPQWQQHDSYALRFVQQLAPPGAGGPVWFYDAQPPAHQPRRQAEHLHLPVRRVPAARHHSDRGAGLRRRQLLPVLTSTRSCASATSTTPTPRAGSSPRPRRRRAGRPTSTRTTRRKRSRT
jgi:hypothetical protein